jgi:hypothetical protein
MNMTKLVKKLPKVAKHVNCTVGSVKLLKLKFTAKEYSGTKLNCIQLC